MSLRFRQLQAFHAVIDTGTVTGAAEQLGISQPGISNLLSQLERQTRVSLFKRNKGRLVPTPEADLLFREVDTVVRGLDHVAQAVNDLQNKQAGQLQIASQHAMSFGFMPRVVAEFARERPDMSISFQSQYSSIIQEWIVSGLFEIGICEGPIFHDGLNVQTFESEMFLVLPETHPLGKKQILQPDDLAEEQFVVMGPEHVTNRRMREALEAKGLNMRTRVHTHMFKNVLSFVKEGMGIALLDRFALEFDQEGGFIWRRFEPRISMQMAIVTSRNRPLSAVGQDFLEVLEERLADFVGGGV